MNHIKNIEEFMSQNSLVLNENHLSSKIYTIRGKKVMLDRDLAQLYSVETKRLNEQVKRNSERFPERYMFKLSHDEWTFLRSQFATLEKKGQGQYRKYPPYAFTEHGVSMLSTVLKSQKAIEITMMIIDTFVRLREIALTHQNLQQVIAELKEKQFEHDKKFEQVFEVLNHLIESPKQKTTKEIIKTGENDQIEFKSSLRWNYKTKENDKNVEFDILRTITAFMNTNSGTLLIGVSDKGKIIGFEADNFPNKDKCQQYLTNLVKSNIGVQFNKLLTLSFDKIGRKEVLRIDCDKSQVPAYLKHKGKKHFYIRTGPATTEMPVNEIHDYIKNRFKS